MDINLEKALELRKNGKLNESNNILIELAQASPNDAFINYQCAWSFDLIGEERKAVPYYENALHLGLSSEDMEGAIIGLGSTYRTLGEYEKSKRVFQEGIEKFPDNQAIKTFYSMTLYNLKEYHHAMELLLKCLLATTKDSDVLGYRTAIEFYSDKLDEIWV